MLWVLCALGAALAAYLLGSVTFAIIVSKHLYGEDVRSKGSGNAGMTNMLRNYGKKAAAITFIGDFCKGILAVFVGRWIFSGLISPESMFYGAYIGGIFAIIGHMFPVFFKFKGGKGIAVSGGAIFAINPILAIILIAIFLVIAFASKMVSLGSIIGISMYPVTTFIYCKWLGGANILFSTICALIVAVLVVYMHRSNIKRIIAGTENKVGQKKNS